MRMRVAWLIATALAYGVVGGSLFDSAIWGGNHGLAWTRASIARVYWAAAVLLVSTIWLALRHPSSARGWISLHAGAAFLIGAIVTWGVADLLVRGSQHGWDTNLPSEFAGRFIYCTCAPRSLLLRQTFIATVIGTIAAAALAPLVARTASAFSAHLRVSA